MNKIIYRIAAYYNSNNTINSTISQDISNNQFNNYVQTQNFTNQLVENIIFPIPILNYGILNAGLCGDTFNVNKDIIVLEWQVKYITKDSIYKAIDEIDVRCQQNNIKFNSVYRQKLINELKNYINDHYYLGLLLVFQNNTFIKIQEYKYFDRGYNIQQIKDNGLKLINQFKANYSTNFISSNDNYDNDNDEIK